LLFIASARAAANNTCKSVRRNAGMLGRWIPGGAAIVWASTKMRRASFLILGFTYIKEILLFYFAARAMK